jgi:Uma2 family endonuclease
MAIHPPRKRTSRPALPAPRPKGVSRYHGARMTEEEFLSLPEEKPYLEYIDGVVLQKPMANADHAELVGELVFQFGLYKRTHGGRHGPESRTRLGDVPGYRVPDASYWAPGKTSGNDSIPTLAVEVRSPGQAMWELREKCRRFRRAGVDACWLIDPASRTVEVFEGSRDGDPLDSSATLDARALPGFSLPLAELFAVLDR